MKVKLILRSGVEIVVPTHAPTMEAFMEELTALTTGAYGTRTKYVHKYGDFLEVYGEFVRFSEIDIIREVTE